MDLAYVDVKTTAQLRQLNKLRIEAVEDIVALSFQLLDVQDRTPLMDDPYAPQEAIYLKDLFCTCKHALKGVRINLEKLCDDKLCKLGGEKPHEWVHIFRLVQEPLDFTASPPRSPCVLVPRPVSGLPMGCRML